MLPLGDGVCAKDDISSTDSVSGIEVVPLAMTGSGSWAETDLVELENGNSAFDIDRDVAGPFASAVPQRF